MRSGLWRAFFVSVLFNVGIYVTKRSEQTALSYCLGHKYAISIQLVSKMKSEKFSFYPQSFLAHQKKKTASTTEPLEA